VFVAFIWLIPDPRIEREIEKREKKEKLIRLDDLIANLR
jgi:hypothetical protein